MTSRTRGSHVSSFVGEPDLGPRTEVAWSTPHGLATLESGGRIQPEPYDQRLDLSVLEWLDAISMSRRPHVPAFSTCTGGPGRPGVLGHPGNR
ncbi:hypothetical protein [Nocardia arthritidis]|uniref:hypothetical protein n=1 Tax=Nocardia arthritidis TaxID=228602 RepID=UPI0012EE8DE1|nr:hypothetical protein [Nocardia arthritidis]